MVLATIGTIFGGFALDLAKAKAGDAIDQRLSGSDLKNALNESVGVADEKVPTLFAPYQRDGLGGVDGFLKGKFGERAIAELTKPLQNEGKPDDELLTRVFLREADTHSRLREIDASLVADWMRAFADAYFETTTNFLKFRVTQARYYRQLRSKTGKVVFSGMAVDGMVVDEPGELARIFVMPDVQRQGEKGYEPMKTAAPEIAEDPQKLVLWEQQQALLLRPDVRSSAATSLVQIGQASNAVVEALLNLFKDDALSRFSVVSDRAAQSIVTLAKKSDIVEPALVQWIEQHQNEDYVGNGIDALWEMTR